MTVTYCERTATIDGQFYLPWESSYVVSEIRICLGNIQAERSSDTKSVLSVAEQEEEINPYECARSSRVLTFWDQRDEDIYSFDDGKPV